MTSYEAVVILLWTGRKFEPREMGRSQRKTAVVRYSLRTSSLCGANRLDRVSRAIRLALRRTNRDKTNRRERLNFLSVFLLET